MAVWKTLFTKEWVLSWQNIDSNGVAPVFLVGFPRSGTTLLEQVLDAHPDIVALEEKNMLEGFLRLALATTSAMASAKENLKGLPWPVATTRAPSYLNHVPEKTLHIWRDHYWKEAGRFADVGGRILIDKMPLNTMHIGFILRLFPNACFIVALRHPADCVLSGYMLSFKMSDAMANFLDLKAAAIFYKEVMALLGHYEKVFDLSNRLHFVQYEGVTSNFDGEVREMLGFLGVPWRDEVKEYASHTRQRGTLNTPSFRGGGPSLSKKEPRIVGGTIVNI